MKSFLPLVFLVFLFSCDTLRDVNESNGPCNIILTDGSTIVSNGIIEIQKKTGTITYRDEAGKLWSLFLDDYRSYTC
jgi:hypothetical protein